MSASHLRPICIKECSAYMYFTMTLDRTAVYNKTGGPHTARISKPSLYISEVMKTESNMPPWPSG